MGHRDNLLTAARSCLLETGFAATTVRDLVAASGANQASINYHFGSKGQLMARALFDLNREWGLVLIDALGIEQGPDGLRRLEDADSVALWERLIRSIRANEALWFVNFESIAQVPRDADVRSMLADGQAWLRNVLAFAFADLGADADPKERHAVGSLYYSLLFGVALQWLTGPDEAPSAATIAGLIPRESSAAAP